MKYNSGLMYRHVPDRGHRLMLRLTTDEGGPTYQVPAGDGAYSHLVTEQLKGFDLANAARAAFEATDGTVEPLGSVYLDLDDIAHLERYQFQQGGVAAPVKPVAPGPNTPFLFGARSEPLNYNDATLWAMKKSMFPGSETVQSFEPLRLKTQRRSGAIRI